MKLCSTCETLKTEDDFYRRGTGLRSMCKVCYSRHNSIMREKHSEKRVAYDGSRGSGWDRTEREKYEQTPDEKHDSYLNRTYGIDRARYQTMLAAQDGVCAICSQECNRSSTERLNVDHDHSNGFVRGLLCFKCNVGIGRFNDDPALVLRAYNYLLRASQRPHQAVFLCGPMSGLPKFNYPAFFREAKRLRALGFHVENPAENSIQPGSAWASYMRMSITRLLTCNCVALLNGWEKSKGARLEHHIATQIGMVVYSSEAIHEPASILEAS